MPRSLVVTLGVAEAGETEAVRGFVPGGDAGTRASPQDDSRAEATQSLAALLRKVLRLSDEARDASSPTETQAKLLWMQHCIQEGRADADRLVSPLASASS